MNRRRFLVGLAGVTALTVAARQPAKPRPSKPPRPTPTPWATPSATPSVPPTSTPTASVPPPTAVAFGTLMTDPARALEESAADLRIAGHEVFWDRLESSDGVFRSFDGIRADHDTLRAAGLALQLEPGIHYPPQYAYSLPGGRYLNQFGRPGGHPNMTWSAEVRGRVERYITNLAGALDLSTYAAIRVGAGGDVEALFPNHNADGVSSNGYWAFDAAAQAACPLPGLKPGATSTHWAEWFGWYVDCLVGEVTWKMALYRSLGFAGAFHVLMPGSGARPSTVASSIANRLTTYGDVMARGAAWHEVAARLAGIPGVVAYCSSAAEYALGDYTQPGDQTYAVDSTIPNPWSSMRWLTFLAGKYGLDAAGENPGFGDSTNYGLPMARVLVRQAKTAGWASAFWAHDHNLYDGTGPTLAEYAAEIAA